MTLWTMGKVAPPYKQSLAANVRHAPGRLRAALAGLTPDEIASAPVPGKWTVRQLVEHTVLVSLGWTDIYRESVAPIRPEIGPFHKGWKDEWDARTRVSIDDALAVMELNHAAVAAGLDRLPEEAFTFEHPSVQWLIQAKIPFVIKESVNWGLSVHVDHHLIPLHAKRVALGKPLDWMAAIHTG